MDKKRTTDERVRETLAISFAPFYFSLGASIVITSIILIVFTQLFSLQIALIVAAISSLLFYLPIYFIAYEIGKIVPLTGIKVKVLVCVLLLALVLVFPALVYSLVFSGWWAR